MALSNNLISQFVKVTSDNNKSTKNEGTAYGTTVINNGITYVRLDGSEQLTPVSTTANIKPDERVMVKIKNHSATIVGNLTSPAARIGDVNDLQNDVNVKFDTTNGAIEAEVSRSTEAEGELASRIKVTEDAISTEVTNRQNADDEMSTIISQTAQEIATEVTARQNADSILSSQISQTASNFSIELSKKVGGDEVRSKFAMSSEKVTVDSGQITFKAGTIVFEGNNFSLDENGNFYIVGSMTFSDGDYETTILDHDGKNRIYLQNLAIDFSSCTDYSSGNELSNLAFTDDIPDMSGYVNGKKDPTWTEISSNTWVVTSFSLGIDTNNKIYVSGNHIKKSLSDKRLKEHIDFIDDRFIKLYDSFKPTRFKFHNDIPTIQGEHFGLYAQDVVEALDSCGIDRNDLRLVWQSPIDEEAHEERYIGDMTWNMDYDELHALHIYYSQYQQSEIESLKQENLALKNRLSILEMEMEELKNVINSKNN